MERSYHFNRKTRRAAVCTAAAFIIAVAAFAVLSPAADNNADAVDDASENYNTGDIAVINSMIKNNNLRWTKATSAQLKDGRSVPDDWKGVYWEYSVSSMRIVGLDMEYMGMTGKLDLTGLTELNELNLNNNHITELDVSGLNLLTALDCRFNFLTKLNLAGCVQLEYLNLFENELTELDVTGCTRLGYLECQYNLMESTDKVKGISDVVAFEGWDKNGFFFGKQRIKIDITGRSATEIAEVVADVVITKDRIALVVGGINTNEKLTLTIPIGKRVDWRTADGSMTLELKGKGGFFILFGCSLTLPGLTVDGNYIYVEGSLTMKGDLRRTGDHNLIVAGLGGTIIVNGNVYLENGGQLTSINGKFKVTGNVNVDGIGMNSYALHSFSYFSDDYSVKVRYPLAEFTIRGDLISSGGAIESYYPGRNVIMGNVEADGNYAVFSDKGNVRVKGNVSVPNGSAVFFSERGTVKFDGTVTIADPDHFIRDGYEGVWVSADDYSATDVDGYKFKYTNGKWIVLVEALPADRALLFTVAAIGAIGALAAFMIVWMMRSKP